MSKRNALVGFLVLLMIFLIGCNQNVDNNPQPEQGQKNSAANSSGSKEEVKGNNLIISGKVEAVESANLISKVAGKVAAVHVDMGSTVKAGQLLISLAAEDKAAEIEEQLATINSSQVQYNLDLKNYERGKELLNSQAISQADFEKTYEGPFQRSEATLKLNNATLKKKQVAYDDMFIKAPFDGIISAKNINPGEMASTSNVLLTLVNIKQVEIKGSVSEAQINKIKAGQEVQVKIAAMSDKPYVGKVKNIGLAEEAQTKAYPIKVLVDNPEFQLKPGMFAEISIPNN